MPFECVNSVVIDCAHILALCQIIVLTPIPLVECQVHITV